MVLIPELIFFLATLCLATFLILLGERFNLHVQRGWYVIITAFVLLFMGSALELVDSGNNLVGIWASQEFISTWIKEFAGYGLSTSLLLVGLVLWAPAVVASRERYLTRIKSSEQRYRLLTENASDMLSEHDLDGSYSFVTPASLLITGYTPEELEGRSIYEFIDPEQLEHIQEEHSKILESDETIPVTYRFKHKEGHFIWLESASRIYSPSEDEEDLKILAVSRDVTERTQIQENLKQLNRSLDEQQRRVRLLYNLSASTDLATDQQLQATLEAGLKTLGLSLGIISRIRTDEYKVLYFAPGSAELSQGQQFTLGDTYCSIAVHADDIIAIDAMKDSEYSEHPCYGAFGLESYIGVPIRVGGKPFGTLNFSSPKPRITPFSESDYDFVRLMGQWVSRVLEQEQSTLQLQQSEEKFRAVVRSAAVGVITMDPKGTIESVNEAAQHIFGYAKDEITGQDFTKLMSPPDEGRNMDYMQNYLEAKRLQGSGESREVEAYRKDGTKIILDLSVNEVATETSHFLTGMVRDITEQKKAADDLATAHLQLQGVFDSATQVSIIATDRDGAITIFNPGAERMLGYTSEEIIGQQSDMFHLESEVQERAVELSKELGRPIEGFETYVALARLGGYSEKEWTYIRKDGSQLQVESSVTAMYDTHGEITGFLGIALDITERKRAEEALKLAKSVAESANQTKSEFLANMSHELRTPLNSVIGFSNIILRTAGANLDANMVTYLERILANGQHLLELINDILDLSKVEAGSMELEIVALNVGDLIKDLLAQVESQVAQKSFDMVAEIPEELDQIKTDPGKLKQVILNLVSNAIKFTEEGQVVIRVRTGEDSSHPAFIEVEDTGIGIPEDRVEHIFDEFEQVDTSTQRKYGGTGLGLSISKALCELMGYTLTVTSQIGQGSTFIISIPDGEISTDSPTELRQKARSSDRLLQTPADSFEGKRILIVDDDSDSRTLLAHYLKDSEAELELVDSVPNALDAIAKNRPDLITLDLQMPTGNGQQMLEALQEDEDLASIPIVVVSIVARDYRGKLDGVVDFVQKPVSQQDFIWAIRRNIQSAPCCVLLIEDDPDMRDIIQAYLVDYDLELRMAGNGVEALDLMENYEPNLILLDLRMPEMGGFKFIEKLKESSQRTTHRVVVITGKPLTPEEEVLLQNDNILVIKKDVKFEEELRRHLAGYFSQKLS